jgi:hypothetical protein
VNITPIPQRYKTSDGMEHETEAAAVAHQAVLDANEGLKDALKTFNAALAATLVTADGEPFRISVWHDYYFLTMGLWSPPQMQKVSFSPGDWRLRRQARDNAVEVGTKGETDEVIRWFAPSSLYYHERNAERAWVAAQEKWVAEKALELAETRRLRDIPFTPELRNAVSQIYAPSRAAMLVAALDEGQVLMRSKDHHHMTFLFRVGAGVLTAEGWGTNTNGGSRDSAAVWIADAVTDPESWRVIARGETPEEREAIGRKALAELR